MNLNRAPNPPVPTESDSSTGLQPWMVFVAAFLLAVAMQVSIAATNGGIASLVRVGEDYPARDFIVGELGEVPLFHTTGHDGQASYVVAREPFGGPASGLLDEPSYRYIRWLYPAVGGMLGFLSPTATVYGLALWASLGFAFSALALAMMDHQGRRLPEVAVLGALLNVGLWLSVILLTPDALGLGLSMLAVATYRRGSHWPTLFLLVGAALTKEQFVVFAVAVAIDAWLRGWRSRSIQYVAIVGMALGIATWLAAGLPPGSGAPREPLAWPFVGLYEAVAEVGTMAVSNLAFTLLALAGISGAAVLAFWARDRLVVLLTMGWVFLAVLAGPDVWLLGNNALRVFAAVWPLMGLATGIGLSRRRGSRSVAVL